MTTYQTADEALQELKNNPVKYQTLESLQKLASEVSSYSEGKVTVLYSAADSEIYALLKTHPDTRMIGKTEAAAFLEKRAFEEAVADAMKVEFKTLNDRNPPSPLNEQFNGIRKFCHLIPSDKYRVFYCPRVKY